MASPVPHPEPTLPRTHAVTVLIADDNVYFRAGMVRALQTRGDFAVVADVDDGAQAYEAIRRLQPDIALLDARMPVLDGLALAERLARDPATPHTRVVVLSAQADSHLAADVRAAGAHAFLDKTQPRRAIGDALLVVAGRRAPDG